jgi:hypothetical protein
MEAKGKFQKFDDEDLTNKNISLGGEVNTKQVEPSKPKPKFLQKAMANKEVIAVNMTTGGNVTEKISQNVMNNINNHLRYSIII